MLAEQARIITEQNLKRIEDASRRGCRHEVGQQIRRHIRSRGAAYDAAYRILPHQTSPNSIEAAALALNLFEPHAGSALYWMQPKRSGGQRVICALPPALCMRQVILHDVIRRCFGAGPHLYLVKGRGRDLQARHISRAIRAGYVFGWQADVRSAYPNAHISQFLRERAPIPVSVLRNTLHYEGTSFRRVWQEGGISALVSTHYIEASLNTVPEGPSGLIQGAASSSAIFNLALNDLPKAIPVGVRIFVYGDNILLLARREGERDAAGLQLGRYMERHPAGPFRMTGLPVAIQRGFDHLGYRFERDIQTRQPTITIERRKRLSLLSQMMEAAEDDFAQGNLISPRARAIARRPLRGYSAVTNARDLADDLIFMAETGVQQLPGAEEAAR